ncbi:forkhead box protein L2-like isoform X7 [Branchiostoma floridae]|uniref:Forkhead box protein L2-like isoform X7 n=1 Tax=Branchiostoma floridae TaxID=7739 RepID=A0A9J7M607_BRAFL|nr:forkhead box protein L2-like isoform X7 [Branchiostoma floridae]
MGKGERRGGRARAGRARHHHNHFQQRRRLGGGLNRRRGGGGGRGITLNFSGSQGAGARYYSAGISLFMISLFLLFSGIPMTVIFSGFDSGNYYPLIMIGIGGALFVAAMFMCARAKRKSAEAAATNPTTQDTTGTVGPTGPPQTAGVFLQPAQPTAPDPMYFSGAMPGQPMAMSGLSYPSAGQPYPGSQPYPGPAAAGGFGPAPSAPPPSGPAPPPQYGFTYNTSDNYNTQYSAGTSDLPPPPAYSTVVNEKL